MNQRNLVPIFIIAINLFAELGLTGLPSAIRKARLPLAKRSMPRSTTVWKPCYGPISALPAPAFASIPMAAWSPLAAAYRMNIRCAGRSSWPAGSRACAKSATGW